MDNENNRGTGNGNNAPNPGASGTGTRQAPPYTQPPTPPEKPQKTRRVGTFTFGLVLVALGVLLLVKIAVPSFNLSKILQFSPAILIALGLEVLIYAGKPDVKLKYDFLSMIVCFIVICAAVCSSFAVEFFRYYSPDREYAQNRVENELSTQTTTALKPQADLIRDVSTSIYFGTVRDRDYSVFTTANLTDNDTVHAEITLSAQYATAEAFATDCKTVLDAAKAAGLPFNEYHFDTWMESVEDGGTSYQLDVNNWLLDADVAHLAQSTSTTWWWGGDTYDSAARRDAEIRRATAESAESESDMNQELNDAYNSGYTEGYRQGSNGQEPETSTETYDRDVDY